MRHFFRDSLRKRPFFFVKMLHGVGRHEGRCEAQPGALGVHWERVRVREGMRRGRRGFWFKDHRVSAYLMFAWVIAVW